MALLTLWNREGVETVRWFVKCHWTVPAEWKFRATKNSQTWQFWGRRVKEKIGNCQGDIFCPHMGVLNTVFNLHASLFTFDKDNNFVGGKTILLGLRNICALWVLIKCIIVGELSIICFCFFHYICVSIVSSASVCDELASKPRTQCWNLNEGVQRSSANILSQFAST